MPEREYIIFCDESDKRGKHFSNFYGGVLVGASQYMRITARLEQKKQDLNLFGEVKWEKVTERYLPKYQALVECFFDEVIAGNIKVRVMFTQNACEPVGLTAEDLEMEYFKLYYQFIKHGFGLYYIPAVPVGTALRLYFDQFPDTGEKVARFKGFLLGLNSSKRFRAANIRIAPEDVTEVISHDHVLLQCLDIVLGSMSFRLNDKHKEKPPGQRVRGKKTRAKEALYNCIRRQIEIIRPRFNVGTSTGYDGDKANRWRFPYMHWRFLPADHQFNHKMSKHRTNDPTRPTSTPDA